MRPGVMRVLLQVQEGPRRMICAKCFCYDITNNNHHHHEYLV